MTDRQKDFIKTIPTDYKGLYVKLFIKCFEGKGTYKDRCKAKCLDCTCFQPSEIRMCGAELCPMWAQRPYQRENSVTPQKTGS